MNCVHGASSDYDDMITDNVYTTIAESGIENPDTLRSNPDHANSHNLCHVLCIERTVATQSQHQSGCRLAVSRIVFLACASVLLQIPRRSVEITAALAEKSPKINIGGRDLLVLHDIVV